VTTLHDPCDDVTTTLEIFMMTSDDSIWQYLLPISKVACLADAISPFLYNGHEITDGTHH
jgi:hypothetical protein